MSAADAGCVNPGVPGKMKGTGRVCSGSESGSGARHEQVWEAGMRCRRQQCHTTLDHVDYTLQVDFKKSKCSK